MTDKSGGPAAPEPARASLWAAMWRYKAWWLAPLGLLVLAGGTLLTMAALHKDPRAVEVDMLRGLDLAREGKWEQAAVHFRRAVESEPDSPEANWYMGRTLVQLGKGPEGGEYLEKAVRLAPDYVEAYMDLGYLRLRQGNAQEARKHFERVLTISPGHPGAVKALSQIPPRRP